MKKPFILFAAALFCASTFAAPPLQAAPPPSGFEELAERLLPTVVNISTTIHAKKEETLPSGPIPGMPSPTPGSPFDKFFKEFYDQFNNLPQQRGQRPQRQEKTNALGSGFVINAKKGYIVTNNHVIKGADEINVILQDNTSIPAELIGTDEKTDLAVLKIKPVKGMTDTQWGDSDTARVGSWIIAIGNPFGLGGTVTAGIVSARQRDINAGPYDDFIQTDASINRGNSGGPMFNTKGNVVGVNTAIFSPSGGSVGIGFAVPSNLAKGVVNQLIKYGKTKRGWIGVRIQEVTEEIAESLGLEKAYGALVSSVTPKGPSEKAGIKAGDVLIIFNGKEIKTMRNLPRIVAETEVGIKVPLTVWRKNKKVSINITLGQLEKAEEKGLLGNKAKAKKSKEKTTTPDTKIESLGLSLSKLDQSLRKKYGVAKNMNGVAITAIKKDGVAANKGIRPGDIIVEVDQKDTHTPKDIIQQIKKAEKAGRSSVLFFIARKEDMRFVALKLKK